MMNSILRNIRTGFNRQAEGTNVNSTQQRANGSPNPSPTTFSPTMPPPLTQSSSFSSHTGSVNENGTSNTESQVPSEQPRFFFHEKYAKLGVKGNLMPLAVQPTNIELADWLAHQTVEQYRLVSNLVLVVQEVDTNTGKPLCNPESCPKMTAGRYTYTWLDSKREPMTVSAQKYMLLVQRWLSGKIHDQRAFPTDPQIPNGASNASGGLSTPTGERSVAAGGTNLSTMSGRDWVGKNAGFPETFLSEVRNCFRQIFRLYAHLYHSHWVDPFYHLSGSTNSQGWTDLNSCFVHFCSVAKLYGLLTDKDTEPMQPLIDMWIHNGSIPPEAANGACAVVAPPPVA